MILGIVGGGSEKFTPEGEALAKKYIDALLTDTQIVMNLLDKPFVVRSGHSIKKGIDIWTEEIARNKGITLDIKAPKTESWNGDYGYRARNLDIADSDEVVVIIADTYPPTYKRKTFEPLIPYCYHCKDKRANHVKSGACWTGKQAEMKGKKVTWILIHNDGCGAHKI